MIGRPLSHSLTEPTRSRAAAELSALHRMDPAVARVSLAGDRGAVGAMRRIINEIDDLPLEDLSPEDLRRRMEEITVRLGLAAKAALRAQVMRELYRDPGVMSRLRRWVLGKK